MLGKLATCAFVIPVPLLSLFPARSRRGDFAFRRPFHDHEEFYQKRSKVFGFLNPLVLALISEVASASAGPLPRIPAALHGQTTLSWVFTPYFPLVMLHADRRRPGGAVLAGRLIRRWFLGGRLRAIARWIWLIRWIRYPRAASIHRISRIHRINRGWRGCCCRWGWREQSRRGSELDRRLDGHATRPARAFTFGTLRFAACFCPR